jgi:hypothetical protein
MATANENPIGDGKKHRFHRERMRP